MSEFIDVRLQGFQHRTPLAKVYAYLDKHVQTLAQHTLPLSETLNCILAQDVIAETALPAIEQAAVDGYAINGIETVGASDYNPLFFSLQTQVMPNSAVVVAAGQALPNGADAVLPIEYAELVAEQLLVTQTVAPRDNILSCGLEVQAGQCVLCAGQQLRVQDLGLLAALDVTELEVQQLPQVAVISFISQLGTVNEIAVAGQILDSNSWMLQSLIKRDGGICQSIKRVAKQADALKVAIQATTADVLLIIGGSGVGSDDVAANVVDELGEVLLHGIALRPADSMGLGRIGNTWVVMLPGFPATCLSGYDMLAGRLMRQLAGYPLELPYPSQHLPLAKKLVSRIGTVDYCPVKLIDGQVMPIATRGTLSGLSQADGFVVVEEALEGYAAGSIVTTYTYTML